MSQAITDRLMDVWIDPATGAVRVVSEVSSMTAEKARDILIACSDADRRGRFPIGRRMADCIVIGLLACLVLLALCVPRPNPGVAPVPTTQAHGQFCAVIWCRTEVPA